MTDLAKLVVRLEAQTGKYVAELDRAQAKLARFEAATQRSLAGIATSFKSVLTGAAVIQVARSITNLGDEYVQLQNSLKVAGLEGENLLAVQARLFAAANRNGVEIDSLGKLYQRSSIAARELGATQSELLRFIDSVTAALRVQGGSPAAASGALLQLSQALGSGIVRAEEFNSILEGALPIAQAVAAGIDRFGGSVSKLRAAIIKGGVTSQEFFQGFLKGSKNLEAQAAKASLTVRQSFTVLRNNLVEVVGGFTASSGVSAGLSAAVLTLANNVENLAKTLAVAATAGAVFAVGLGADRILRSAKAFAELFSAVASGRAILLGSAAADRAKAAAAVAAAQADVDRTSATLAAVRAEQARAVVATESTVITDAGAVAAVNAARADQARAAAALEAVRAEQAKAVAITETTVVTDASAVAAVAAARAEHARTAAVLASARADAAQAVVVGDSNAVLGARLGLERAIQTFEAQEAAAKQALTAAEARLAAATVTTNNAQFARIAAARQLAAVEAEEAVATQALAAAEARLAAATTTTNTAIFARAAAAKQIGILEAEAAAAQAGLNKAQSAAAAATTASTGALGLLRSALARVLAPLRGLVTLIAANPISAIVAGVAAAVAALVAFSDQIKTSSDGVITLRDTAIAAWQLIGEGLAPLGQMISDAFRAVTEMVRETFGFIIDGAKKVADAINTAFDFTPTGLALKLLRNEAEEVFDKVQERARQIAEARRAAQAAGAEPDGGTRTSSVGDDKALKTIKDLESALRQQIATTDTGAVATIKYRIAQGDLSDEFRKAGAAADPYRRSLVSLTSQLEGVKLKQLTTDLYQQIGTFNLTGATALRYRLELGDLKNTYKDAGAAGRKLADDALYAAGVLERLQLDKTLKDINAEILELKGNTAQAFAIRLEVENAPLRSQLTALGDQRGLDALNDLERLKQAQAEFSALETEQTRIKDELARQEERIRNSQEVGALSEVKALEQISQAREIATTQLDTILGKMRAIAIESQNPALAQNVAQAAAELEKLTSQVNLVGQAIQSAFEEHATAALEDFLTGVKSAEDAFRSFLQAIETEIARFVARDAIKRMFGDLFVSGGGGGGAGWFGQFASWVAGQFAGGAGAAASGAAAGAASGSFVGPRMASGGRFQPGVPTLVGERGPEVVIPRNADVVVPNHDVPSWMRAQRPIEVVQNFNVSAVGGQVERRTLSQISAAAGRGIADASRRNN